MNSAFLQRAALVIVLVPLGVMGRPIEVLNVLRQLDAEHPKCERPSDLSVIGDYVVPIANDLPGVVEYNRLVQRMRKKEWAELFADSRLFRKQFETSPLVEAASFLEVTAKFAANPEPESSARKEAEQALRELTLLYPKSTLLPLVTATTANYWLQNRNFEKSLSLYQSARDLLPLHELACVFQAGIAESRFFLREFQGANASFSQLLQKCQNRRLVTLAKLRLIDGVTLGRLSKQSTGFEKLVENESETILRYFPEYLAQYGEERYSKGEFKRATHYFGEFLKSAVASEECALHSRKRLADMAFKSKSSLPTVVGMYLDIYERNSASDPGLFSKVLALLLELKEVPRPEQERRIKWIDDNLDRMGNASFRDLAYLSKGLMLLDMESEASLGYLLRINDKTDFGLHKGNIASFVREKLLDILNKKRESLSPDPGAVNQDETVVLGEIETAFRVWLKGTSYENRGKELYTKFLLSRVDAAVAEGNSVHLIDLLDHWKRSQILSPGQLTQATYSRVASQVLGMLAHEKNSAEVALTLMKAFPNIEGFVGPFSTTIQIAIAVELKDDRKIASLLKKDRSPASIYRNLSPRTGDYVRLVQGRALLAAGRFVSAEKLFLQIKEKSLAPRADLALYGLYSATKQQAKRYSMAKKFFQMAPEESKKEKLAECYQAASEGKLWPKADELLQAAEKIGLKGPEEAPYLYFAGKAEVEKKNCSRAVDLYERALLEDGKATEAAEGRYHLGKCLVVLKKPAQARQVWQQLIQMNDSFWSPLAKNEISLL